MRLIWKSLLKERGTMAIYKNGELSKGNNIVAKANPPAPILSDVEINKAVEDYISCAAKAVALLEAIYKVSNTYGIDDASKVRICKEICSDYKVEE